MDTGASHMVGTVYHSQNLIEKIFHLNVPEHLHLIVPTKSESEAAASNPLGALPSVQPCPNVH